MMHEVHFVGFHGSGYARFRGPADGFLLSDSQAVRWRAAVCPVSDCICRGRVSLRFDRAGASIEPAEDGYRLIPCPD